MPKQQSAKQQSSATEFNPFFDDAGGLDFSGAGFNFAADEDTNDVLGTAAEDGEIPPEWEGVDIEAEAAADVQEMSEALRKFKERAAAADQRLLDNTDSEFWICVGFQNRAMKEEFLKKAGLFEHGDKYLDGVVVARVLGIQIETPIPSMPNFGFDSQLGNLAPRLDEPY